MGLRTLRRETGRKAADAKRPVESGRHRRGQTSRTISAHPDPEQESESPKPPKVRTGIVSVNGQDVGVMHCRQP